MALVKCEECGKEISNKAKSCPHCGYPVEQFFSNKDGFMEDVYSNITKMSKKENFKVEINEKENVQKEKEIKSPIGWSKKDTFFCLGALLFCILVAIPMISAVEGKPLFSSNSSESENDNSGERIAITLDNYDEYLDFDVRHTIYQHTPEPGYYTITFDGTTHGNKDYVFENVFIQLSITFDYDTVFDNSTTMKVQSDYFQLDSSGYGTVTATSICVHKHAKNFDSRGYKIESITGYVVVK